MQNEDKNARIDELHKALEQGSLNPEQQKELSGLLNENKRVDENQKQA